MPTPRHNPLASNASRLRQASSRLFTVSVLVVVLALVSGVRAEGIDWRRIGKLKPEQKVVALLEADQEITLQNLAQLADLGLIPADRDPGLVVGAKKAVFTTKIGKWLKIDYLPTHINGRLLDRFYMSGIYRTSFKVEKAGYTGPLTFHVTAPRDGFGRELVWSQHVVRPRAPSEIVVDAGGNRWLKVTIPKVSLGTAIRFNFAFRYLVNMAELFAHDVFLAEADQEEAIPNDVLPYTGNGYKINPRLPQAVAWAMRGGSGQPDVRWEYRRLERFLKERVVYDKRKRETYFGGRSVYSDVDQMYQNISLTLARGLGACPDTCLLECAFLRARGIPCRTAGRFGHFFTMVYMPGPGWVSTSSTPTGIPLIIDPGPDFVPYQRWEPRIPLRTSLWEARIRIEPVEE